MGVRAALRRRAVARPAVLLAAVPGGTPSRLAVERAVRAAGWPLVEGPAAADLLVVAGRPAPGAAGWWDELYDRLPGPRARVSVAEPEHAARALSAGRDLLRAAGGAAARPARPSGRHGGPGPGGPVVAGPVVAGPVSDHLPLAERGDDRDGLRLDVLRLPLGPVLLDWPAGLVLRLALQGDVVVSATMDPPSPAPAAGGPPFWDEPWLRAARGEPVARAAAARRLCAAHLDSVGRLLGVAGWAALAGSAHRLRDGLLTGADPAAVRRGARSLVRRGERSLTARWMLRGLGRLPTALARRAGVTGPALAAGGDAYDRFRCWLAEIERSAGLLTAPGLLGAGERVGPRGRLGGGRPPSAALLDVLPRLVEGSEFGAARLVVASLDPDLDELSRAAAHG
ncbi:hypothetical protein [Streptomyces hainanensis]|uniref:Uncharacterized protein n=1 Tax=Streptomyces hainanensis TaxID=402648 RepID=A0A4R4SXC6_9ACTN|nr:hypothetical protein [Streptomyces hainanensis]TDC67514.1 hypothetical protein E1283_28795 [Streptomyces hainanensis]